ncbi:MAG: hypothetical protein R3B60_02760 [Candidatus Paceibacterota bacterium]
MLNQEQSDYIKSLKVTHPDVEEGTLKNLLINANWSFDEVEEAIALYKGKTETEKLNVVQPPKPQAFVSSQSSQLSKSSESVDVDGMDDGSELINPKNESSESVKKEETNNFNNSIEEDPKISKASEFLKSEVETKNSDNLDKVSQTKNLGDTPVYGFSKSEEIEVSDDNPTSNTTALKPTNNLYKVLIIIFLAVFCFASLAFIGYYAYQQFSFNKVVKLNNQNILSTTLAKMSEINSAAYKVEFGLSVNEREANARSIDQVFTVSEEEREALNRDKRRVDDISEILSDIRAYPYRADVASNYEESQSFPLTLDILSVSSTDPFGRPYLYELTEGGEAFSLTAEFETDSAINSLKERDYLDTLIFDDKKVTFQQNSFVSSRSFDGKPEYPKIIEAFADGATELELIVNSDAEMVFAVDGAFDKSVENSTDLRFGVSGQASFGDMMFAVAAEFRKKAEDYYFVATKFPAFLGNFNNYKGKWIHFTQADVEEEVGVGLMDFEEVIEELNGGGGESVSGDYQAQFEEIIKTADKHSVFMIESSNQVIVDERELTEYKLRLSRDNIVTFYEDISAKLATYDHPLIERNEEVLEELKKADSALAFDFINENITLSLFYDKKGFPVRYQIDIRYIPTLEAVSVKDKQVNVVLSSTFTNINKRNEVETPNEYIELKDVLEEMKEYSNNIFLQNNTIFKYASSAIE